MFTVLEVNQSKICHYRAPCIWTSEYYYYCLNLLITAVLKTRQPINIIFGDMVCDFKNTNKTIKIDIQSEHTLVKLGGRSVDEIIFGNINLLNEDGKYLIRIPNYNYYSKLDATIEYSLPNIVNVNTNERFADYVSKAVYVAPLIYDKSDFAPKNRFDTITIFSGNHSERRKRFVERSADAQLNIINIQNAFKKDHLKQIYDKTKIMVNVHQTDEHHTLEELRILPALCNGVIIVSEHVPLMDSVPYAESIVWSSYDDLTRTIKDVQDNYQDYYNLLFTDKLANTILKLNNDNIYNLHSLIAKAS